MKQLTAQVLPTRRSRWGEGPFWHRDALWYVDIEGHSLLRFDPATGAEQLWNLGQRIGFARPLTDGGLIWGGDHGLYRFDPASGASTLLPGTEPESPDHRYNDAGVSPDGILFAGTISLRKQTGSANLYRIDSEGRRTVAHPGVTNSNGIAWSPDGAHCHYIDTPTRRVLRFAYRDRQLVEPEVFIETNFIDASPDGLSIDADGHLWIAFCHGGCVIRFDAHTGEPLLRVNVHCLETTACAFGGPELRDLYITTGVHATLEEEHAGQLFVLPGLDTPGLEIRSAYLRIGPRRS